MVDFRPYDPEKDAPHITRVWHEVGWIEECDTSHQNKLKKFLNSNSAWVAEIDKKPEACVTIDSGIFHYLHNPIASSIVSSVTTGLIARNRGITSRLLAHAIAENSRSAAAPSGGNISLLSCFDDGYYNRLGFGTSCYERECSFDPSRLKIARRETPIPRTLTAKDWKAVHRARRGCYYGHGTVHIDAPEHTLTMMELGEGGTGWGCGFWTEKTLTHGLWGELNKDGAELTIFFLLYHTMDEFLDLLWILHTLGEQVMVVKMMEPTNIQLQDFISVPFREYNLRKKAPYSVGIECFAWSQLRILNLAECLAKTSIKERGEVAFNLRLSDPIEKFLDPSMKWRGSAGDYFVVLGEESTCTEGHRPHTPLLETSVNDFTCLWIGAIPIQSLLFNKRVTAPPQLCERLSWLLQLPEPHPSWGF